MDVEEFWRPSTAIEIRNLGSSRLVFSLSSSGGEGWGEEALHSHLSYFNGSVASLWVCGYEPPGLVLDFQP